VSLFLVFFLLTAVYDEPLVNAWNAQPPAALPRPSEPQPDGIVFKGEGMTLVLKPATMVASAQSTDPLPLAIGDKRVEESVAKVSAIVPDTAKNGDAANAGIAVTLLPLLIGF
jgi:hypothetical protein